MDVVYTVRTGPEHEELRHSLRSLRNLADIDDVWIVGHRPRWVRNVGVLQTHQYGSKWQNTTRNLLTALDCGDISDPFLLFNDDFFCMEPSQYQTYDRGTIAGYLDAYRRDSAYRRMGLDALKRLTAEGIDDPLSFEMHMPLEIHKAFMRDTIVGSRSQAFWKRSFYGNRAVLGGVLETQTRTDVKVTTNPEAKAGTLDWISTSDTSFKAWPVGQIIRDKFPDPSRWEQC